MSRQTRRLFSFSGHDKVVLGYLVSPSWFSGFVAVTVSLIVVIGSLVTSFRYNGVSIGNSLQQLLAIHGNPASVTNTYQSLGQNFAQNVIVSDIPLFIFWAGVGLVIYSFAVNLMEAVRKVADLSAELKYVNADRHELMLAAFEHLAIRIVVLGIWLPFMLYSLHVIVPYALALAQAALGGTKLAATGYVILGIILLSVCLHLHTVLLRLLALRPRLFWRSAYD